MYDQRTYAAINERFEKADAAKKAKTQALREKYEMEDQPKLHRLAEKAMRHQQAVAQADHNFMRKCGIDPIR